VVYVSLEEQEKFVAGLEELGVREPTLHRVNYGFGRVSREDLLEVVERLKEAGFRHITTISAVDMEEHFEVVYHLRREGFSLSLKVEVPKDDPKVPSITGIHPGATLYEREVNELMGIFPEGHPNPARLLLDYDWPEGVYPLRKEETVESLREKADAVLRDLDE